MELVQAAGAVALAAVAFVALIAQWPTSRGDRAAVKRDLEILQMLPSESASRERLLAHIDATIRSMTGERPAGLTLVVVGTGLTATGVALIAFGWTLDNPVLRFAVVSFGVGLTGEIGKRVMQDLGWLRTSNPVPDDVVGIERDEDQDRDRQ